MRRYNRAYIRGNGSAYGISQDVSPDMTVRACHSLLVISGRPKIRPLSPSELKKSVANPLPNCQLQIEFGTASCPKRTLITERDTPFVFETYCQMVALVIP